MATIEFTIKGLAACYRKEGNESWNIAFPTDENHRVKFYWTKDGNKQGPIELADKDVKISSTDTEPPANYEDTSFIKQVIDLTDKDYLHSEGLIRRAVPLMDTRERLLQIPHANLSSKTLRDKRLNYVFPLGEPEKIRLIKDKDDSAKPRKFSKLVGGTIKIKQGGKITIEIDGEESKVLSAGDSFEFDNDCFAESERNDFQLYQDIFANRADTNKLFEMISVFEPKSFVENKIKRDSDSRIEMTTDPPPLVCDTARISDPSGLD